MAFIKLTGTVGLGANNDPNDVRQVKTRLRELGFSWVSDPATPVDAATDRAIKLFQAIKDGRHQITNVNGKVTAGGNTHLWLEALNAPRWTKLPQGSAASGLVHPFQADEHDFATVWLLQTMQAAGRFYAANFMPGTNNPPISINNVSLPQGGNTASHETHETGLNADIRLPKNNGGLGGITFNDAQYDRPAMRQMLKSIEAQPLVKSILFNDPVLRSEGLSVFSGGHDNHAHVIIRPPAPQSPIPVKVSINNSPTPLRAFMAGGITWLPVREAVTALRVVGNATDGVTPVNGPPFRVKVNVKNIETEIDAIRYFGDAHVATRDLAPAYSDVPFNFVGGNSPRLEIG